MSNWVDGQRRWAWMIMVHDRLFRSGRIALTMENYDDFCYCAIQGHE